MVTKKLTIALALIMGSFSATFAGTPKSVKDASSSVNSKVETDASVMNKYSEPKIVAQASFTYYVIGDDGTNYEVSTDPQECDGGDKPCEVQSSQEKNTNNRIPQSAVTSIVSTRSGY